MVYRVLVFTKKQVLYCDVLPTPMPASQCQRHANSFYTQVSFNSMNNFLVILASKPHRIEVKPFMSVPYCLYSSLQPRCSVVQTPASIDLPV